MRAHLARKDGAARRLRGLGGPAGRVPRRRRGPVEVSGARAELIEDGGAAAVDDQFFRSRPFLEAEGVTHTLRIESEARASSSAPDRPRVPGTDARDATSPYGYPGWSGPRLLRRPRQRPPRSRRDRLERRPASSASSSATPSAPRRWPARPSATSSRSPTRSCRRRAGPATAARCVATSRPATSWRSFPGVETGAEQRAGFLDVYEQTMRRADAAAALLLRRRLLRPHPPGAPHLARPRDRPRRRSRRRLDRDGQRRLPPLLPQRQRRLPPARLADEERRRPPRRARRRARPAAQPRRRHLARRRPRGVQARLRQPAADLAHLRADLRRRGGTSSSVAVARPAASSPPTAPSFQPSSGSAGVGPVKAKPSTGSPPYLPQVSLPKARIASSVAAPLYSRQVSRLVQVDAGDVVDHFVVREEQRRAVHRVVEPLQFELGLLGQVGRVLDREPAVLERVDDVELFRFVQ